MGVINIRNLEPGMVTAGDVTDSRGQIILGKGRKITEKHLRIFSMWGVTEAKIEGLMRAQSRTPRQ